MHIERIEPGPGQESAWDYPLVPRVEQSRARIEVHHAGMLVCRTRTSWRVLEARQPPTYFIAARWFVPGVLAPSGERPVFTPHRGVAVFMHVVVGDDVAHEAAWTYPDPSPGFEMLREHVAVSADAVDSCTVDGEEVEPQLGDLTGGWITSRVTGPFKGHWRRPRW